MKNGNPLCLFAEVFQNGVVLLRQDPHRLVRVPTRESKFGQHVFLFGESLTGRAVVDDIQRGLTGKDRVKRSQVLLKAITRVDDEDLGVCPNPGSGMIRFVPTYRGA